MSILSNRSAEIVETDYREKPYFSDRQSMMTFKDKCFVCVLALLGCLFTMNMVAYSAVERLIN